ncbi:MULTISPECIES: TetR/AcrR family transcriptional regulator [unclassified Sphingomonas]|uniref:TetR/AcrR family transcriptional regulator n=1 Tax=Sphingomonas sp. PvP015 TaxID=3156388 RepID=UPI00339ACCE1
MIMTEDRSTRSMEGSKRKRGRPSEAERRAIDEHVIDAAFAIFRAQGFDATRMDKVAAAAGITKMSLYRRFPGKGELLAEVIERQSAQLQIDIPLPKAIADPIAGIKVLMWTYRERIGADKMLALQRLALTALPDASVRRALADVRARYVAPVDVLVDAAKACGTLPRLPTEELREILFDLLVNDAASLPLHGYSSVDDQRRVFLQRWSVLEKGLLRVDT